MSSTTAPPDRERVRVKSGPYATSELGQKSELANYGNHISFRSVGEIAIEHRRNSNTERLSGLEVDDHIVFCRCLHWRLGGFLPLEDAIDVSSRASVAN